jgi:hypothetical protein
MLNILGNMYPTCDRISRRHMLKIGGLALGGLGLDGMLRHRSAMAAAGGKQRDLSVILIWQSGGPSHMDMWDLKPSAPAEIRGAFNPIATNVPGYQVSEHMPRIAKTTCDKLCVLRSVTHADSGHESASHALLTGYKPTNDIPSQEMPSYGSIVSKEKGARKPAFPAYVAMPEAPRSGTAGYLGVAYNAFEPGGDPNSEGFRVRNLQTPGGVTMTQLEHRVDLLKRLDRIRRDADASGRLAGMDAFGQQAWDLITSPEVRGAFDLSRESAATRDRYGRHTWGQSALMARRLVESGVRFVTLNQGGWDTHSNNFEALKNKQLPPFDQLFSALINDLDERGRLDDTLVLVWGEFGRTPRINPQTGRDHWSNVFSVVMAGGGLKRGVILGESDSRGEFPKDRPVSPQDVLATMYHLLGINRHKAYVNDANRPVEILNSGQPIDEILA